MFCLSNLSPKGLSGRCIWHSVPVVKAMSPFVSPADLPQGTLPVASPWTVSPNTVLIGERSEIEQERGLNHLSAKPFQKRRDLQRQSRPLHPHGLKVSTVRSMGPTYCKNTHYNLERSELPPLLCFLPPALMTRRCFIGNEPKEWRRTLL